MHYNSDDELHQIIKKSLDYKKTLSDYEQLYQIIKKLYQIIKGIQSLIRFCHRDDDQPFQTTQKVYGKTAAVSMFHKFTEKNSFTCFQKIQWKMPQN